VQHLAWDRKSLWTRYYSKHRVGSCAGSHTEPNPAGAELTNNRQPRVGEGKLKVGRYTLCEPECRLMRLTTY